LIWSLIVLDNSLTEKYFEVESRDDNDKPLKLRSFNYGLNQFTDPFSMFDNENDEMGAPVPMIMAGGTDQYPGDMDDLISNGYEIL